MSRLSQLSLMGFVAVAACNQEPSKQRAAYDGTLALSNDGALLYTANADTGTVSVVDASSQQLVATVSVGQSPARVVVGPDDSVYVTNRGSRSVSVIHRGTWSEASRLQVGAEPVGLALSGDGSTLYVANTGSGTVDAVNLATQTRAWETTLGDYPRGVAVLPDGRLYVSHYKNGQVDVLDGPSGNVLRSFGTAVSAAPVSVSSGLYSYAPAATPPSFRPVALDSIVLSRDGSRAYLPHRRDRIGVIRTTAPAGYYTSAVASTPVVVPALTTVDIARDVALDDAAGSSYDYPAPVIFPSSASGSGTISTPPSGPAYYTGTTTAGPWSQGPVALVEDAQGSYLYVANENTDDVTVLQEHSRLSDGSQSSVISDIQVGNAPTGLALSADGKTLFVHNSLDYSVSVVQSSGSALVEVARISVSSPGNLTADAVEGRRLFFSATDPIMTVPGGGVACESCHLEASSDANVWQFTHGPRKTISLVGRHVADTAPYHWDGTEFDDAEHTALDAFYAETVQVRMGGIGVSEQQGQQIAAFMQGLTPLDNPYRQAGGGLTAAQQRGQALFAGKAACIACHSGANFTDNLFHDVGTFVSSNPNGEPDDACRLNPAAGNCVGTGAAGTHPRANPTNTVHGYNTPSLLGVVWAAPYLHDGSAPTLADRLLNNPANAHGNTSSLSADEVSDLVQYLQTL
ncbi:MAG: c-type cytochrome [Myxococcales bacterium]